LFPKVFSIVEKIKKKNFSAIFCLQLSIAKQEAKKHSMKQIAQRGNSQLEKQVKNQQK